MRQNKLVMVRAKRPNYARYGIAWSMEPTLCEVAGARPADKATPRPDPDGAAAVTLYREEYEDMIRYAATENSPIVVTDPTELERTIGERHAALATLDQEIADRQREADDMHRQCAELGQRARQLAVLAEDADKRATAAEARATTAEAELAKTRAQLAAIEEKQAIEADKSPGRARSPKASS